MAAPHIYSYALLALLIPFNSQLTAQESSQPPVLTLDAGGHTADIYSLAFTPDGTALISASSDYTIRCWDVKSGEIQRVLRLPVYAPGAAGKASLSADGRLLAAAMAGPQGEHWIVLLSLPEGQIVRRFEGHPAAIWYLLLSPDGKRLASGSKDGTTRIWDVASGRCEHVLHGHRGSVTALTFSPDGRQLATASYDETARIWSVATGRTEAILQESDPRVWGMCGIGWSPDGKTIATGSMGGALRFWSPEGMVQRRVPSRITARSIRFTADSSGVLIAGVRGYLVDVATGEDRAAFTLHQGSFVWSAALSPDGKIAATGGQSGEELYLWSTTDGRLLHQLSGPGRATWGAAWSPDGQRIAWGVTARAVDHRQPGSLTVRHPLERSFSLVDLDFGAAPDATFRWSQPTSGSLTMERNVNIGWVKIKDGEQDLCILRTSHATAATFLPEDRLAVAGFGDMQLYDARNGAPLRSFTGHLSALHALAPSPDGRFLLSSAGDQTLRIWALERSAPLLSLFVAGSQWIAWTPEGYYAASPGGERLMGWLVNNGPERLATFHPAALFRQSLYRPDVIRLLLKTGNVEKALVLADQERGRETPLLKVAEVLPPVVLITSPDRSSLTVTEPEVTVRAAAQSVGAHPLTGLRLLLDGRPYPGADGLKTFMPPRVGAVRESWTVRLEPGKHTLAIQAESAVSKAVSEPVEIVYDAARGVTRVEKQKQDEQMRPCLYVIAVGVSEYPGSLKLNYATKDAQVLAATLQATSKALYRKVEVKLLTDQSATRRNVLQALTWLRKQMTQRDVAIVSFAGHGARDIDGKLYLFPVDVDVDDLVSTGIPGEQIKSLVAGMPGRVLMLLDACHSGAINGQRSRSGAGTTDDLVRDLVTDDYGVVVMCSSMGREVSLESAVTGHGFFTLALVEGLRGKADFNQDGAVHLNELDLYVTNRVKELSGGRQHPVTARPTSIRSFPLSASRQEQLSTAESG